MAEAPPNDQQNILVVSDSPTAVKWIAVPLTKDGLKPYCITTSEANSYLGYLKPALIILQGANSFSAYQLLRKEQAMATIPMLALLEESVAPGLKLGIAQSAKVELGPWPISGQELLSRVNAIISARYSYLLPAHVDKRLIVMLEALKAKDPESYHHSFRVGEFAKVMAIELGMDASEQNTAWLGGLLHDLGKLVVSQGILDKVARLSDDEFEEIKEHSELGTKICSHIVKDSRVIDIIQHHHENWDGTGYPDKLKGSQISICSRIVMLANAFDALTNDRPYHRKVSYEEALEIVKRGSGTQFDPDLLPVLERIVVKGLSYGRIDSRAVPASSGLTL